MRLAPVLVLVGCAAAFAENASRDLERPPVRKPYAGLVIEWISQDPRIRVERDGDRSEPPPDTPITYTAHFRNLSGAYFLGSSPRRKPGSQAGKTLRPSR